MHNPQLGQPYALAFFDSVSRWGSGLSRLVHAQQIAGSNPARATKIKCRENRDTSFQKRSGANQPPEKTTLHGWRVDLANGFISSMRDTVIFCWP